MGAPETTAPRKNIREPERQETQKRQKLDKEKEIPTNVRRVEDKILEGATFTFEVIVTTEENWENHLKEHRTR